jgi:hypothetical protein
MSKEITVQDKLRVAEECLRDIRERVEHSGTFEQMMKEINIICDNYWNYGKNMEK